MPTATPPIGVEAFQSAKFGPGSGLILLDDVNCIGNEGRLIDCRHRGIGTHNCIHFEDAGARCKN